MNFAIHPDADDEVNDAAAWYDSRRLGVGEDFYDAVGVAYRAIARQPRSFGRVPVPLPNHEVRRFVIKGFPYSVYYDVRPDGSVIIVAVAHQHRQQDYWHNRLTP